MSVLAGARDAGASSRRASILQKPAFIITLVCVSAALWTAGPASAQEFRWVTGKVAAWTNDTLTVLVPDVDVNLTFALDDKSLVVPPAHRVREWPSPAWKTHEVFPPGAAVEVHYVRQPTRNYAGLVRRPAPGRGVAAGTSAAGVVTSVSNTEVSVRVDERQESFAVVASTRVAVDGPPPDSAGAAGQGETARLKDYVSMRDLVLVFYRPGDKPRTAIEIAVLRKHE